MTDQNLTAVTDNERRLAREWAESIESATNSVESTTNPWSDRARAAARVILDAVPAPSPPTLADMTKEERHACRWMQADTETWGRAVILLPNEGGGRAVTLDQWGHVAYEVRDRITPRPDLPRMEWPSDKKAAPAPDLPDGWRLADHRKYGRVIVTNPTPNRDGYVYIVLPIDDPMGYDWHFCDPDDLTYIDADQ